MQWMSPCGSYIRLNPRPGCNPASVRFYAARWDSALKTYAPCPESIVWEEKWARRAEDDAVYKYVREVNTGLCKPSLDHLKSWMVPRADVAVFVRRESPAVLETEREFVRRYSTAIHAPNVS